MAILKTIVRVLSFVWLAYCFIMGIYGLFDSSERGLTEKDKMEIELNFKPSIAFIDSCRTASHQLPDPEIFDEWQRTRELNRTIKDGADSRTLDRIKNDTSEQSPVRYICSDKALESQHPRYPKTIDWQNNYILADWRGDWDIYYSSWDKKYIGYDYQNLNSRITDLFIAILIGLIPLGTTYFFSAKRIARRKD